jgi:hypothetical protein
VAARGEHAYVLSVDLLPRTELFGITVGDETAEIERVGAGSVRREPPLTAEMALESREPIECLGRHGVSRPYAAGFIDSA